MSITLSRVAISRSALTSNIRLIRGVIGKKVLMAPAVKSNAYGHGLVETATAFLDGGADWLCVNALFEAQILRKQLPKKYAKVPILILGYTPLSDLKEAVKLGCRLTVYNRETIAALKKIKGAIIHIKVETGNHRQGIHTDELVAFVKECKKNNIIVEGISTHFANIEDIAVSSAFDGNSYPRQQLKRFLEAIELLKKNNIEIPLAHCANSAATLLFPETHFQLVRPGVAAYGMWPSPEVESVFRKNHPGKNLRRALSWKTHVVQIKEIPAGAFVGYGCTFQAKRPTRLAILPVGYYDGYDRGLSNKAQVLIHKKRAPVVGRVCMNIMMVDVTDIPRVKLEDPVTLIGDGITAQELALWADTINYEITTRINETIPRIVAR
ncbi:alanine racemase [Candidatus Gracilibacteria bacterium]|nr:alanine racemase [Candidatus Gracilibacteria bacterium]